jgi:predicted transport protein
MPIFKQNNGKLEKLKLSPFSKERTLQTLIEPNLLEVLDMHFLASEYPTTAGGRIDTLAIDTDGAPVIIEYKLNKNENVINQALSYLSWLKAQKIEFFEMLVIKKLGKEIAGKLKIDWSNPRVICIAENYSKFDIDTVEVIPMRIELIKYRNYENGIFHLDFINKPEPIDHKTPKTNASVDSEKIITHLDVVEKANPEIKEIFHEIRGRIMQLDDKIVEKINLNYFAYRVSKNFAELQVGRTQIILFLRPNEYLDPLKKVTKVPDSYNWTMTSKVILKNFDDIQYALDLIEQSYKETI